MALLSNGISAVYHRIGANQIGGCVFGAQIGFCTNQLSNTDIAYRIVVIFSCCSTCYEASAQADASLPFFSEHDQTVDHNSANIEAPSADLAPLAKVKVRGLRKEFPNLNPAAPPIVAINNVSLDMYEGQIFALLGHNGAGKTTTINILTGMYPSSGGNADIYGHSLQTDLSEIRQSLGVCPQHNILFDVLTVREHLVLFAMLKGEFLLAGSIDDC